MSKLYEALRHSAVKQNPPPQGERQVPLRLGRQANYRYALTQGQLHTVKMAIDSGYARRKGDRIGFMTLEGGTGADAISRDFAVSEAENGIRTLLIDADTEAMPLRWYFFGDQKVRTLSSTGHEDWEQSICDDLAENLDFMIVGNASPMHEQRDVVTIDRNLIMQMTRSYDVSVFLLGTFSTSRRWIKLARELDGLFVVSEDTQSQKLAEFGESLHAHDLSVAGAIVYG